MTHYHPNNRRFGSLWSDTPDCMCANPPVAEPGTLHVRTVDPGPGHYDADAGGVASVVHLDLDYRGVNPDTDTVAELHLGLSRFGGDPFDTLPMDAVGIELTLGDLRALLGDVRRLIETVEAAR